jgi:polyhydroxyalkanoate synthesis regulator phasin
MSKLINRAFKVSKGIASLTQKKVKSFVNELASEGILTKNESAAVVKSLAKLEKTVSKTVGKELRRILITKKAVPKKAVGKKTKKNPKRKR